MPISSPQPLLDPLFLAKLEQLELISRKIFLGLLRGERKSKKKGQSVEFADFRNYSKGDDLRFLDWNLLARLDRLFIRLFQEEEDLHVYVLVDQSTSMGFGTPTKLQYARQVAAALAFIGLVGMDRVVVQAFTNCTKSTLPAMRGRRSYFRVAEFLERLDPGDSGNFAEAMKSFAIRSSGKGVVIVLSDFMDKSGYEDGFRYLAARQYDVFAIQVLALEEVEPELAGDLKLIDAEDGDEAEVTISGPLLQRYRQNLAAFQAKLQEYCNRRGISFIATTNQVPFDRLVLSYLRQRGLVR